MRFRKVEIKLRNTGCFNLHLLDFRIQLYNNIIEVIEIKISQDFIAFTYPRITDARHYTLSQGEGREVLRKVGQGR